MDQQTLNEYLQMLSNTRAQLEMEIVKLKRELNELRALQAKKEAQVQT